MLFFQCLLDGSPQASQPVFQDVVSNSLFHGSYRNVLPNRAGNHDERNLQPPLLQKTERSQGVELWHSVVGQNDVRECVQLRQEIRFRLHRHPRRVITRSAQFVKNKLSIRLIIFKNQNSKGRSHWNTCVLVTTLLSGDRRLVQEQPVKAKLTHGVGEMAKIHRLADVTVDDQLVGLNNVPVLLGRSEDDNGNRSGSGVGLGLAQHFHAVHQRQFQIQQNQRGAVFNLPMGIPIRTEDKLQGFNSITDNVDVVGEVVLIQSMKGQFQVVGIVLDQQDFHAVSNDDVIHETLLPGKSKRLLPRSAWPQPIL